MTDNVGMHLGASEIERVENDITSTVVAAPGSIPTIRTALGVVVGEYKQAVTCHARRNNIEFGWQSRYHDHIIRGTRDGNLISEYIENNVA